MACANMACSSSGSARPARPASAGRRVRRSGSVTSPASGPASAAARCLNCSVVAAPSPKQALTAASSRVPPRSPPAAAASTCPAPACAANACSSIAPAYRDHAVPSATTPPAAGTSPPGGTAPAPGTGTAAGAGAGGTGTASGPGPGAGSFPAAPLASSSLTSASQPAASPSGSLVPAGSGTCGPRRRPAVVPATPSRRPISRSLTPDARNCRAFSSTSPSSVRGRPGPARFTSAADPSRCAAACSVATYAADSPNTSATRLPPNPDRRATVIAKFRSTTSVSAYSASTAAPTIIRHRSPECSRCRPRGSGMSSSIACTMGRIPLPYSEFNKYAAHLMKKNRMSPDTQLKPSGDLGPAFPLAADMKAQEVEPLVDMHHGGLLRRQPQPQRSEHGRHLLPQFLRVMPVTRHHYHEVSRPGEFHPRPLAEPAVHVSAQRAPIAQWSGGYAEFPLREQSRLAAGYGAQPRGRRAFPAP